MIRRAWNRIPRPLRWPAIIVPLIAFAIGLSVAQSTGALAALLTHLDLASNPSAPANDDVANAIDIGTHAAFTGTTSSATTEAGEPGAGADDHTVWFAWTPTQPGMTYLVPTGTAPIPVVRAYTGASVDQLTRVDVSDAGDSNAAAAIPAVAGQRYLIQVDADAGDANAFGFSVFQPVAGAPENDNFLNATSLAEAVNDRVAGRGSGPVGSGTTAGATAEAGEPGAPVHSVWYSWSSPPDATDAGTVALTVTPRTAGAHLDVAVYSGPDLSHLALVAPSSPAASATFAVAASTTYLVQVDGDETYFDLSVTPTGVSAPDTTPPVVTCDPPSGWHSANVTVDCTATDTGSGLADAADAKFTLHTALGVGVASDAAATDSRRVCDKVGNCSTAGPVADVKIDPVAPEVSCDPAPAGWVAANVSVTCTAADPDSGLVSPADATFTLSTSVAAGDWSGAAAFAAHPAVCDAAGNCTKVPAPTPAHVDRAAPVVKCGAVPSGWHDTDPTVTCTAHDSGAGLARSTDTSFTVATGVGDANVDKAAETVARPVCDLAGNCTTAGPFGPIPVDRRAPVVDCTPRTGWQVGDKVSVACTASDDGAGLAHASDEHFALTAAIAADKQGAVSTGTHQVCDNAGNCATAGPETVQLDDAPPVITCQPTPTQWEGDAVVVDCTASDAGSGISEADSVFTLQGTTDAGTASTHVSIPSRQVCDAVGNCAGTPKLAPGRADRQTPKVTCVLPAAGVHYGEVTVNCTASDGSGSGLADAGDASFTLSTDVGAGNADTNAVTGTADVCDAVGNCTTAGPVGPIDVDRASAPPGAAPTLDVPVAVHVLAARPASAISANAAGAGSVAVPYDQPLGLSDAALDVSTACNPSRGAPFPLGTTVVVCGARDAADRTTTATFPLDVVAAPQLAPSGAAAPGATWRAVGTGFAPNSKVGIELDGVTLAHTVATPKGTISAAFAIPAPETVGSHVLVARGVRADGTAQLVVTPLSISANGSPVTTPTTTPTTPTTKPAPPTTGPRKPSPPTTVSHPGQGNGGGDDGHRGGDGGGLSHSEVTPATLGPVSSAAPAAVGVSTPLTPVSNATSGTTSATTPPTTSASRPGAPTTTPGTVTFGGGKPAPKGLAAGPIGSKRGGDGWVAAVVALLVLVGLAAIALAVLLRRRGRIA